MESKIVQWVQCDNQIKEYNDKMKEKIAPVKQMRDKLSEEILHEINIGNVEKSHRFQHLILGALNMKPSTVGNSYEGYNSRTLLECFSDYFNLKGRKPKN